MVLVAIQTRLCQFMCLLSGQNLHSIQIFDQGHLGSFCCHYDLKRFKTQLFDNK